MYEPATVDFISMFAAMATGTFIAICFIWGYLNSDSVEPLKIPDKFELGYIEDRNPPTKVSAREEYDELKDLQRQVKIKKLKQELKNLDKPKAQPKPKTTEPKKQVSPIITDCIDAMIAMGEKKSAARATVNKYFVSNPNTKSVEDFLSGVFKK
tara:strand:- start:214 stop:675 length:462 start_codon:yes stop_codon:yes gene_type:complete